MKTILRNLLLLAMAGTVVAASERRPKEFTTEIHKVVEVGDLVKMKRLLDARQEWVNEVDGYAHTPLHIAVMYSRTKVAEYLLLRKADINAKDVLGSTPLHLAGRWYWRNSGAVAKLLLSNGADVNAKDDSGRTPLHEVGSRDVAEALLARGANVNARDCFGSTPLHEAKSRGVAEVLLAHGADANAENCSGETALHKAWNGDVAAVLLRYKAQLETRDKEGLTPLHRSVGYGQHSDVARVLLAAGANPDAQDYRKFAPLHSATQGSVNLVRLLLLYKADINIKTENGDTPLRLALRLSKDKTIVEILLAHKADVNSKDVAGNTVLHEVASRGEMDTAKLLLAYKANVNEENDEGRTPLDDAEGCEQAKVADFLRAHGGKKGLGIKKSAPACGAGQKKAETPTVRVTNAADYARVYVEPELTDLGKKGKWDETNLVSQVSTWLVKEPVDLTGEWVKSVHDDVIVLILKKRSDGKYDAEYNASGDLARWTLRRTGSFDGGVLSLDRPVQGYIPRPASRFFYLLRTPIGVRFIEQHAVREWIINKRFMRWPQIVWDQFKEDGWDDRTFLKKKEPEKQKTTTRRGK